MAIFGKKPDSEGRSSASAVPGSGVRGERGRSASSTKAASFLGPGCRLDGELRGKGSFECRGRFQGTVEVEGDVIVGPQGRAEARLSARRIVIDGHLEGDAIGVEKVEVGARGRVEGDVRAPAVMFQEGAFFEGNVEMNRASGGGAGASAGSDGEHGDGESDGGGAADGQASGPAADAGSGAGRGGQKAGN